MQEYKTLKASADEEYIIKKSRFIGYSAPVSSEKEALDFIAALKKKHWDATHNVYAYRIKDGDIRRFSDDGEPQGTAGVPVLNVLLKEDITDCVTVVTRYFGGVLLGAGGLVRAYSHSAKISIDSAGILEYIPWARFSLSCEYTLYGKFTSVLADFGGIAEKSDFSDTVELTFRLPSGTEKGFLTAFADAACGKAEPVFIEEAIAPKI